MRFQGLRRRVFGRDERIEGTIRVTLTSGVAKLIASDVAAFMAQHPRLIVEMNVTNSAEDLELMEADIAIRLTESPPETLVGRKLVDLNSALYAAGDGDRPKGRGAVHRYVRLNDGVRRGRGNGCRKRVSWPAPVTSMRPANWSLPAPAWASSHATSPKAIRDSCASRMRIRSGYPHVWLLYHPQLRNVQRVRTFADHLVGSFRRLRPAFEGGLKSTVGHSSMELAV